MKIEKSVEKQYDKLSSDYDIRWHGYLSSTHGRALNLLNPSKKDVVLEVSGGTGLLTSKYVKKVKKVSMIDLSSGMLKIAKEKLKNFKNINISQGNANKLNFKSRSFNKLVNVSSFHYYDKPNKVISEFNRVLKPGGKLIIIDWCNDSLHFKLFDLFLRIFKKAYVRSYTTKEMKKLLINNGFKVEKIVKWSFGFWSLFGIRAVKTE